MPESTFLQLEAATEAVGFWDLSAHHWNLDECCLSGGELFVSARQLPVDVGSEGKVNGSSEWGKTEIDSNCGNAPKRHDCVDVLRVMTSQAMTAICQM